MKVDTTKPAFMTPKERTERLERLIEAFTSLPKDEQVAYIEELKLRRKEN